MKYIFSVPWRFIKGVGAAIVCATVLKGEGTTSWQAFKDSFNSASSHDPKPSRKEPPQ